MNPRMISQGRLLAALLVAMLLLGACTASDSDDTSAQTDAGTRNEGGEDSHSQDNSSGGDSSGGTREEATNDSSANGSSTGTATGGTVSAEADAASGGSTSGTAESTQAAPHLPAPANPAPNNATADNDQEREAGQSNSALDAFFPPESTTPEEPPTVAPVRNPFTDTQVDNLSTFGLDVDTGSYTLARSIIERGGTPDPANVRIEEFVNAFDYGYSPAPREVFTVQTDLAPWPYAVRGDAATDTDLLLRIGLSTPVEEDRNPASLVFVVDTSGSMTDLLPLVQDSLRTLTGTLEPGDEVSIVTYSDNATPVLRPTDAREQSVILDGIDRLQIGGSTNLEAGLDLGYAVARELTDDDRTTRVILASDGIANVGSTSPEAILETVNQAASEGIELVTVGFGLQGFNDPLMEQLADQGDGFYAYVDTLDQAEEIFRGELIATRPAIAREARTQVIFDPEQVASYRLLGYENRDIADEDFRNDDIDAGELVAGHTVTALYEIELTGRNTGDALATVQLRWLDPGDGNARERSHNVMAADISRTWEQASDGFRLAGSVAAWAETLRDPGASPIDIEGLQQDIDAASDAYDTPQVDELRDLVDASLRQQ